MVEGEGVDAAVRELTKLSALRCFTFKNQSQAIRGYLAAIEYFHKMYRGWELPTSHGMVVAIGKGIDRAHGKSEVRPKVRKPLTWDLLTKGLKGAAEVDTEQWVFWSGLALSFTYCIEARKNGRMVKGSDTLTFARLEGTCLSLRERAD